MMIAHGNPRTHGQTTLQELLRVSHWALWDTCLNNGRSVDNQNLNSSSAGPWRRAWSVSRVLPKRPAWHRNIYSSAGGSSRLDLDQACCSTCGVLQRRELTEVQPSSFSLWWLNGCRLVLLNQIVIKNTDCEKKIYQVVEGHDLSPWLRVFVLEHCWDPRATRVTLSRIFTLWTTWFSKYQNLSKCNREKTRRTKWNTARTWESSRVPLTTLQPREEVKHQKRTGRGRFRETKDEMTEFWNPWPSHIQGRD